MPPWKMLKNGPPGYRCRSMLMTIRPPSQSVMVPSRLFPRVIGNCFCRLRRRDACVAAKKTKGALFQRKIPCLTGDGEPAGVDQPRYWSSASDLLLSFVPTHPRRQLALSSASFCGYCRATGSGRRHRSSAPANARKCRSSGLPHPEKRSSLSTLPAQE